MYSDTPQEIIKGSLRDPAALAFIEKGADYRDRVVSEANPVAVIRSKAVNIRDYTGALMFDEARTRLYFTIRALQDYMAEGRIPEEKVSALPEELRQILLCDKETLISAHKASNYTIVQQIMERGFDRERVLDLMEWVKLGHYDLSESQVKELMKYYNSHVTSTEALTSFDEIIHDLRMQNVRMTEHLTHIKPEALLEAKIAA
jgi:hypothetical protein